MEKQDLKNEAWKKVGTKFAHITSVHPCYNEDAHHKNARIHLPVAPKCNIQCRFCSRGLDKCANRPGAYSHLLSPEGAVERVREAKKKYRTLRVVGIAGPGEPLFNLETFETLSMVDKAFPKLYKCIATNGLLLPKKVDILKSNNVGSVTVTVNGLDPDVVSQIVSWVVYEGKLYKDERGAEKLIENQLEGIEKAVNAGMVVKVNTVLIPSINMDEVEMIAKTASELGAWIMNIIPLIPLNDFSDMEPPGCDDLKRARQMAEKHINQFRLCKQCRADSCGVPGKEDHSIPRTCASEYFHG
ncbi:MAG TPA: radical SAM protein [Candidatus Methanofastidiosa archaeon]|nr:radical SAM protein [Candidatus Methanofastidiosa archaeon]